MNQNCNVNTRYVFNCCLLCCKVLSYTVISFCLDNLNVVYIFNDSHHLKKKKNSAKPLCLKIENTARTHNITEMLSFANVLHSNIYSEADI